MFPLFYSIGANIARIFSGRRLLWFAAAAAVSTVIVYSGFDWWYWEAVQGTRLYAITFPAVVIGMVVPVFGLVLYLLSGYATRNKMRVTVACALGQAAILGLVISSAIKAFTGRIPPPHVLIQGMADVSHGFQFGWLQGGIFWGWPSSHTTVAFAMAAALIALYPRNKAVRWGALIYAFYIGIGVSMGIHWFSEFAAGAAIGWVIGTVVGQSFRPHAL